MSKKRHDVCCANTYPQGFDPSYGHRLENSSLFTIITIVAFIIILANNFGPNLSGNTVKEC